MKSAKVSSLRESEFVSTREAAELLGVAVRTVQLWVESGALRAWKTAGGHRRIPRESVDAMLAARSTALAASPVTAPVSAPAAPPSRPLRILVVEDDPALRMLFEMTLSAWKLPLQVDVAENGFAALLKMGEAPPDLLITDLNMPGMDGFTMIRHLRQTASWQNLPIVVVSALGQREIAARGGLPADIPYFGKPVPFDRIEFIVRAQLASRRGERRADSQQA